ncbi:hypothetical protein F0U59_20840 [Archangium gephyra]|nr:hypothetical protein F0U59_20840 [Archangium gephyra]
MKQAQRKSWKRRVLGTCSALAVGVLGTGAVAATPSGLVIEREWYRAIMGVGIGATGLHTVDLDGDGTLEVVAAAGPRDFFANSFWYVLSRDANGYGQKWVSLPYAASITGLRVAQVDGDAPLEVLVASGNKIYIHDGATHELQRTLTTPATQISGLSVADVDADGALELVFCDTSKLYVLDLATGATEFQGTGLGGKDLAVGQVDADAALEIIIANGTSAGSVVDGATRAVEWSNASGFGDLVRVADLDGDGREEIAAGSTWTKGIQVYDGDTRTLAWSVPIFNLAAMRAVDVEGDGSLELVYGDAQWGSVHVLTGTTGVEQWSVNNPEHGVTDIAVGDVDGDSVRELLFGAGYSSSGADFLYVVDTDTRLTEWRSVDVKGPFRAFASGDVDADGKPELVSGSFESEGGSYDGLYFIHDAATHALEYVSGRPTGSDFTGMWRVATANVDADAAQEVFVTSSIGYDGVLLCYDGLTRAEQWRVRLPSGLSIRSLAVADVDGDGSLEVVSSVGTEHTGAPGHYVYVHDAATGALEWQSPTLAPWGWLHLSLLRVANVDADPALEVVVANFSGQLWVVDPVARNVQLTTADLDITALDTPDRNGDGRAEIVIGTAAGALQVLDAATGAVVESVANVGGQVNGLAVKELTGDGVADYVFTRGNQLRILNGASRAEEWASEVLGSQVGENDALLVSDVDADGRTEMVVGVGELGFMVFDIRREQASPGARYDSVLLAPRCETVGSVCDSGLLLLGRGNAGPELHAPNTLFNSCADGLYGTYHADESNDRIRVLTVDGTPFAAGKTVRVEATVWAWAGSPATDKLDLYYTADAHNPSWQYLTTLTPSAGGEQTLSATYVLPAGRTQAVRARFRYAGSVAACTIGDSYDDQDDLVFAVQ